jgi:ribosomal peptide maturation radical SAM protein 1
MAAPEAGEGVSDVVLVSMPFGNILSPSFGLSLLAAGLRRGGLRCRVYYFTFPFARRVGSAFYREVAGDAGAAARRLLGEWIFARALFGRRARPERGYIERVLRARDGWVAGGERPVSDARLRRLRRARALAPAFIDECARTLLSMRPRLVGFTSVFQQHVASLALARALKRADPGLCVVFGGANCEGPMGAETVRRFPFVDAAVSGEADLVFPELARRVLSGRPLEGLPGVFTQGSVAEAFAAGRLGGAPPVTDLDALPEPDYSDFFVQWRRSGLGRHWRPRLFFESSRGCWWGQKHHCTFCGLNGQTMVFRSKSARRAADELTGLARRHPGCDVQVVDNILDVRYFDSLLVELAARPEKLDLFYETKSNLDREQVRRLHAAGVRSIQPGIESFSDSVLRLMRKGVTGLQNIQLLRWCREIGVRPYWNVLWGFPGEDPAEYARMAALVPLLTHLTPPVGFAGVRLDRFSPNFTQSSDLGFTDVRPLPSYAEVYPLPPEALFNLAYHFRFRYADGRQPGAYVRPLLRGLRAWQREHAMSALIRVDCGEHAVVIDRRACARATLTVLAARDAALYRACDRVRGLARLADEARLPPADVAARLAPLVERGLMAHDGGRYLALALAPDTARHAAATTAALPISVRGRSRAALDLVAVDGAAGLRVARGLRRPRGPARDAPPLRLQVEGRHLLLTRIEDTLPAL